MAALSKKELEIKKKELLKNGIMEVIDSQNIRDYIIKKRLKNNSSYEENKFIQDDEINEISDEVLDKLSTSSKDIINKINKLDLNPKYDNKITIDQIDWNNVKTI